MKAKFMIENPDDLEATLKLTMTIKEWGELRDQLATAWPSARLSTIITNVLFEARKVYYAPEIDPLTSGNY
jgi:hypothetical protein